MQSRDFCFWLQGYFELGGANGPISHEHSALIKQHLALVFKHEIDPAMGGMEQRDILRGKLEMAEGRPEKWRQSPSAQVQDSG